MMVVVVEVVVWCGVLVLLAYCYAYWRMASPLSAGCLLEVPVRDASVPIPVAVEARGGGGELFVPRATEVAGRRLNRES